MKIKFDSPIYFIHANGFLPLSYKSMFENLDCPANINYYLLENILLSNNRKSTILKDWIPFHNDFINIITKNNNKIIGMGHSIGGNIILRAALTHQNLFHSIILLDPTLFLPRII